MSRVKSKTPNTQTGWTPARNRRLRRLFRTIPYPKHLGMKLRTLGAGEAVLTMPAGGTLCQYQGITHGGALASLADTAATFAAMTMLPEGIDVVTIEFKLNFLKALITGAAVAEGRVIRMGQRITLAQVEIYSHRKKHHLTTGIFTMLNFPIEPESASDQRPRKD
jgi:uncharacterized protein (TIGR00369 family)